MSDNPTDTPPASPPPADPAGTPMPDAGSGTLGSGTQMEWTYHEGYQGSIQHEAYAGNHFLAQTDGGHGSDAKPTGHISISTAGYDENGVANPGGSIVQLKYDLSTPEGRAAFGEAQDAIEAGQPVDVKAATEVCGQPQTADGGTRKERRARRKAERQAKKAARQASKGGFWLPPVIGEDGDILDETDPILTFPVVLQFMEEDLVHAISVEVDEAQAIVNEATRGTR